MHKKCIFIFYGVIFISACGGSSDHQSSPSASDGVGSPHSASSNGASPTKQILEYLEHSHGKQKGLFAIDENARINTHGSIASRDPEYSKINIEEKINTFLNESFEYIYDKNKEFPINKIEIINSLKIYRESDNLFINAYFSGDEWGLTEAENSIYVNNILDRINELYYSTENRVKDL